MLTPFVFRNPYTVPNRSYMLYYYAIFTYSIKNPVYFTVLKN